VRPNVCGTRMSTLGCALRAVSCVCVDSSAERLGGWDWAVPCPPWRWLTDKSILALVIKRRIKKKRIGHITRNHGYGYICNYWAGREDSSLLPRNLFCHSIHRWAAAPLPHLTDCIYLDTSLQFVHIINGHRLGNSDKPNNVNGPNGTWVISDGAA